MPEVKHQEVMEKLGELAKSLLTTLTMDLDVEVSEQDSMVYVNFTGENEEHLNSMRGDTVRALAIVFQAYLNRQFPNVVDEVKCDVNGEALQLETSLKEAAYKAAETLKDADDTVEIGPYNSYERRLIHMALKQMPNIESESVGEGYQKKMKLRRLSEEASGN